MVKRLIAWKEICKVIVVSSTLSGTKWGLYPRRQHFSSSGKLLQSGRGEVQGTRDFGEVEALQLSTYFCRKYVYFVVFTDSVFISEHKYCLLILLTNLIVILGRWNFFKFKLSRQFWELQWLSMFNLVLHEFNPFMWKPYHNIISRFCENSHKFYTFLFYFLSKHFPPINRTSRYMHWLFYTGSLSTRNTLQTANSTPQFNVCH